MTETAFYDKVEILADLWMNYRHDEDFESVIEHADLGLPLAYARNNDMIVLKDVAVNMINEAFGMLLNTLEIEDTGFATLDQMLGVEEYEIPIVYLNEDEESDEEDFLVSENEQRWDKGFEAGIQAEQNRIQRVCEMAVQTYLEAGKGQKAVFWREAANDLRIIDYDAIPEENLEDYGF